VWSNLDEVHGDHLRNPEPVIALEADWVSPGSIDWISVPGFDG
jgi:hypothetical protein